MWRIVTDIQDAENLDRGEGGLDAGGAPDGQRQRVGENEGAGSHTLSCRESERERHIEADSYTQVQQLSMTARKISEIVLRQRLAATHSVARKNM